MTHLYANHIKQKIWLKDTETDLALRLATDIYMAAEVCIDVSSSLIEAIKFSKQINKYNNICKSNIKRLHLYNSKPK